MAEELLASLADILVTAVIVVDDRICLLLSVGA